MLRLEVPIALCVSDKILPLKAFIKASSRKTTLVTFNTFSTQPFFIYAQNIMVYNLTAHNYVSLKDNPNKVYIKLKGIGCTI